ncbi:YobH-like protein [Cedecea sp. NFIX57]|nr:YobH-like protein [Cedecea sp. NFIX57]
MFEVSMRAIIRTIIVIAIIWIGLLLSGYGVLVGSKENAAGLGLQCKYLTARSTVTAQFIHTDSGIIGLTDCPLLRKVDTPIDNG